MTSKRFSVDNIEDMLSQLGVLLSNDFNGLLIVTLKKNFYEEYKAFDTITAWDCFVDEVNRVNKVIELHDFLVGISKEDWKLLLGKMNDGDV